MSKYPIYSVSCSIYQYPEIDAALPKVQVFVHRQGGIGCSSYEATKQGGVRLLRRARKIQGMLFNKGERT